MIPGSIPQGPDLDLGGSRERMPGSYPDGRVQPGALYDVIASDLLLRLGERPVGRSEEHTSELQSHLNLVCRLLLEKKKSATASTRIASNFSSKDASIY